MICATLRALTAPLLALLPLVIAAAPLAGQLQCQSMNDDGTFKDGSALGFPVAFAAFKGTAAQDMTVTGAEVFTGESSGTMAVTLWSHDAANNRPAISLAPAGSWTLRRVNCWQGAAFGTPVALKKAQVFWVVWQTTMFCQASFSDLASATPVEYCYSDTGARWYQQSAGTNYLQPAKFRLLCPGPAGSVATYGTGKPGYNALVPAIGICSNPAVGNRIDVVCDLTARLAPGLLLVGPTASIPSPYGTLYVLPILALPIATRSIVSPAPISGYANTMLQIPQDPSLRSAMVSFQYWILDPAAAAGFAHSAGATVTIG